MPGALVLVPNTLDFGVAFDGGAAPPDLQDVLPLGVIRIAARLPCWVAENAKTTRAFLKRVDAVVPLARPLQALRIVELPRPQKGGAGDRRTGGGVRAAAAGANWAEWLAPALRDGDDIGLISEAGLPAVADPGAALVQAAHAAGIEVRPLCGPSSLLLALAASGLHGQCFTFAGYLPVEAAGRAARILELQAQSRRAAQTQIVIETPYRNPALLAALLATLDESTRLSVSCGLTLPGGWTRSDAVSAWRHRGSSVPADVPAVFSWLAR